MQTSSSANMACGVAQDRHAPEFSTLIEQAVRRRCRCHSILLRNGHDNTANSFLFFFLWPHCNVGEPGDGAHRRLPPSCAHVSLLGKFPRVALFMNSYIFSRFQALLVSASGDVIARGLHGFGPMDEVGGRFSADHVSCVPPSVSVRA